MELQNLHFKKGKPFHSLHHVYVQHFLPQLLPERLKKNYLVAWVINCMQNTMPTSFYLCYSQVKICTMRQCPCLQRGLFIKNQQETFQTRVIHTTGFQF